MSVARKRRAARRRNEQAIEQNAQLNDQLSSDYEELSRLGTIVSAVQAMTPEQRERAFRYLKSKYSAQWPSDYSGGEKE
jgi:hypothetical protein